MLTIKFKTDIIIANNDKRCLSMEDTKNNATLDLLKFILACMVVAIHSSLFPAVLYPWLRAAVPLFFIMTSYFFFSKVKKTGNSAEGRKLLKGFVRRNAALYLFYFILLLPVTVYVRKWHQMSGGGVHSFLRSLFFGSTFIASWFITASIITTVIIYIASRRINNNVLFVCSFAVYLICCMRSSYGFLTENIGIVNDINGVYDYVFGNPVLSFPSAFLWITSGKIFADGGFSIQKKSSWIFCAVSALCLYGEWLMIGKLSGKINGDCYVFLVPFCIFFFCGIKDVKTNLKNSILFRKMSTMIYCLHGSVITVVSFSVNKFFGRSINILTFIITLAVCLIYGFTVLKLEPKKYFRWLKYAH